MSKAFTKEDAGADEALPPYQPPWPAGARNYVTPGGLAELRRARDEAVRELAARGPDASPEARRRLAVLDAHLDAAEVVVAPPGCDRVQFGIEVAARDGAGGLRRYAVVGIDEVDAARGRVSWLSPVARALQGARVGDVVTIRSPRGEEELEVVSLAPLEAP